MTFKLIAFLKVKLLNIAAALNVQYLALHYNGTEA